MPTLEVFGLIFFISIISEYRVHIVYLIKMKVLTYTTYKERCELYTEIHGSMTVNSCQIEHFNAQDHILTAQWALI